MSAREQTGFGREQWGQARSEQGGHLPSGAGHAPSCHRPLRPPVQLHCPLLGLLFPLASHRTTGAFSSPSVTVDGAHVCLLVIVNPGEPRGAVSQALQGRNTRLTPSQLLIFTDHANASEFRPQGEAFESKHNSGSSEIHFSSSQWIRTSTARTCFSWERRT